jgi:hypothetical protein
MVKQVDSKSEPSISRAVGRQEKGTSPSQAGVSSSIGREMSKIFSAFFERS